MFQVNNIIILMSRSSRQLLTTPSDPARPANAERLGSRFILAFITNKLQTPRMLRIARL